ncbi:MAG: hypothetical protein PHW75_02250 [Patescibacteria group bacterium]|nr:hypothetical protein [Patescibacteria group bacterium]
MGVAVGVIAVVLGIIALLGLSAIVDGFVLSILWGWFLVPLGAPSITIPIAIGIALIAGMLVDTSTLARKKGEEAFSAILTGIFLRPIFALFVGWIVTLFMR